MNNLFDMLTKAGYEVSSIGNDALPCTLRIGEEPIGFLLANLSLRLLPDRERESERLLPILSFSTENQGIEQEHGEYVLSHYQNVLFTASFDYESCRPIYNIYSCDKDDNWTVLNSAEDKAKAAQDFATRSGLVSGEIPEPVREVDRIERFMDSLRAKGFQVRENRKEATRAFDITDQDGHEIGYIGKDNRVTITSENNHMKKELTDAYLDSNSSAAMLPSFFDRLKERLKEIGMALKVIFTPQGRHYAIHNDNHQAIASVGEQTHTVKYTDIATDMEKGKIDALVDELRREETEKNRAAEQSEPTQEEPVQAVPAVSPEEINRFTNMILSDRASTETFFSAVMSNAEFVSMLNQKLTETRLNSSPDRETPTQAEKEHPVTVKEDASPTVKQNSATQKLKEEFDRDYSYLQTLFGFNQEKYDTLRAAMIAKFGTDSPKEFQAMLSAGNDDLSGKLQDRLETSRKIADMKNTARQTEKTQEKERA